MQGPVRYPQTEISQYAEARPHSDRHRLNLGSIPYRIGQKVRNRLTVMRGLSSKANILSDLSKDMDPKQLKTDDDRSRNIRSALHGLAQHRTASLAFTVCLHFTITIITYE